MDKIISINGKTAIAKEFDFNLICDLEDMGISVDAMGSKPMSLLRAYIGKCFGVSIEQAGKEMESHIIGGGKFDDIMETMSAKMEESDFFRSLSKTTEEDAPKTPRKAK